MKIKTVIFPCMGILLLSAGCDRGDGSGDGTKGLNDWNAAGLGQTVENITSNQPVCADTDGDGHYSAEGCGTPIDCNDENRMVFSFLDTLPPCQNQGWTTSDCRLLPASPQTPITIEP